jgi:ribose 5-phosphate isomerase B
LELNIGKGIIKLDSKASKGISMEDLKVAIGCDHGGFNLKNKIIEHLKSNGFEVKDFGTFAQESCDYPKIAKEVAAEVANKNFDRGILVCGSGIGVSIAANKVKGIRAALCWNLATAELSRQHNNSNVLCLGERLIEEKLALEMVDLWLKTEFEGGRHKTRVDMLDG